MKVVEISSTIHGELPYMGAPCLLIRFKECNLSCSYCDAKEVMAKEGIDWSVKDLVKIIEKENLQHILLTGGEPLLQRDIHELLKEIRSDYIITIETNGSIKIPRHRCNNNYVVDYKLHSNLPSSYHTTIKQSIERMRTGDVIKLVFWSATSFQKATEIVEEYWTYVPMFVFSPTSDIKKESVPFYIEEVIQLNRDIKSSIRFQIQLHKLFKGVR